MALHVSEMSIQLKVGEQGSQGPQPSPASGDACEPDGDDAKKRQQTQMVDETVRRVLEVLKAMGAR